MATSDQGREPPAYQEYAAAMIAKQPYRLMTLAARGLLYSMRLELWVNKTLPADPRSLCKILGFDETEVASCLTAVMPFFDAVGEKIVCPELDAYRAHLEERHLRQSRGGKEGADITNRNRKKPRKSKSSAAQGTQAGAATPSATPSSTPAASGRLLSAVQTSSGQQSSPIEKDLGVTDPWVDEYDAARPAECTAEAYRKASRGG